MSLYIGLGKTGLVKTLLRRGSTRPYRTVRVPDMDPQPSSALSLFILVRYPVRLIVEEIYGIGTSTGTSTTTKRAPGGTRTHDPGLSHVAYDIRPML